MDSNEIRIWSSLVELLVCTKEREEEVLVTFWSFGCCRVLILFQRDFPLSFYSIKLSEWTAGNCWVSFHWLIRTFLSLRKGQWKLYFSRLFEMVLSFLSNRSMMLSHTLSMHETWWYCHQHFYLKAKQIKVAINSNLILVILRWFELDLLQYIV